MRIGLALPQLDVSARPGADGPLRWETVVGWARRAERVGFASLWLCDHLFVDLSLWGGPRDPVEPFDPLPALAALARSTSRPRLGTLTICTPLRPPTVLAKALATLDVLSAGRLVVGLGAGWYEPEFAAAGVPFLPAGARLRQLSEAIDVLRGLFGGGPFTYDGTHWTASGARCRPVPLQQPSPPIWIGGRGDALLRLVAAQADGWNAVWAWTPAAYRERAAFLDQACERAGRDPATVTRSLGLSALVGSDEADLRRRFERLREVSPPGVLGPGSLPEWRRGRLVGTVEQVRHQLGEWAGLGVEELIVNPAAVPFAAADLADVDMLAAACSLEAPWEASEPRN